MANFAPVSGLYDSFNRLSKFNALVSELISTSTLPIWFPPGETIGQSNALVSAKSLTEMWLLTNEEKMHQVHYPMSGLVCANREMLEAICQLNDAKDAFKNVIVKIRSGSKHKFDFEGQLVSDPEFKGIMNQRGLSRIDLMACYRKIRILPEKTSAVSWSWAFKPAGVEKILVSDLIDVVRAGKYGDSDYMLRVLNSMNMNDYVAEKKSKPAQLKVNIRLDSDSEFTEWHPFACSGIMVLQSEEMLPSKSIIWRSIDDSKKRGSRSDSILEKNPFVPNTKLYLYRPGHMPKSNPVSAS